MFSFRPASRSSFKNSDWWQNPFYILGLILLSAVPLFWPELPPLTDAPGHLGRYRVELGIHQSPWLHQWYSFDWHLVGNLGFDLFIIPLAHLFGLELGLKIGVIIMVMVTAAGLLAVAKAVHGKIPPTAAFALPFIYGFPFQFGFLNYCLSMALTFNAFALWITLKNSPYLRAFIFIPFGIIIWSCHSYGWGILGLLCFSADFSSDYRHARRNNQPILSALFQAGYKSALAMLPLLPPILLMILWRSGHVSDGNGDWFRFDLKIEWVLSALRDRWQNFDIASIGVACFILLLGRLRLAPPMGLACFILLIAYICLPRILLSAAFADMRLAPYIFALALVGLKAPKNQNFARIAAIAACLFFTIRTAATTVSFWLYDQGYQKQLKAVDSMAPGSRVLAMVSTPCLMTWVSNHMSHLPAIATVRKDAFTNSEWAIAGQQLLTIHFPEAKRFIHDPSQSLYPRQCRFRGSADLDKTLESFPRQAFDYFWLMDIPPSLWPHEDDLIPIWSGENGILYKIDHRFTAVSPMLSAPKSGSKPKAVPAVK
ncbi:hypothetical protein FBY51_0434 [Zymomonas mobilis]|uniref:hypothetical protein n=1 Tax=Zymomonas mobilis TaxID=542 RepID=UPI00026D8643|nr:hypothetical protein [Zymomonas mobilis]AFN56659.1 hypothetical protein ZZ6_0764 [Zymomonas mobilis subsp. mobilis ATCC 29191]TQK77911.1 hypothetical protein FBY53_0555 [Zymomonas mobilis]TQL15445.1 hypothetical protein FBY51_0434 [Zymomonas mobilis]GEB86841.1 hypothetical protein ZMO01_01810 [Zymomonas mobilis subsp. mobilis]